MRFIARHKNVLIYSLLMILSETAIVVYAFHIVPSSGYINLPELVLAPFFDNIVPMPNDLHYLIPVLVLLLVVIWPLGCSRISIWLIGIVVLYIEILVYTEVNFVVYNAFGFVTNGPMGVVLLLFVPFWCIFFFLWELLFCVIAKLWRKKHRRNRPETDR